MDRRRWREAWALLESGRKRVLAAARERQPTRPLESTPATSALLPSLRLLSVVMPAYNERARIEPSLGRIADWARQQPFAVELLVVDDGSTDGTADCVASHAPACVGLELRVLRSTPNRGKGFAVGLGVAAARGEQILVSDADLSTPIDDYAKLATALSQADIAIGSRALQQSQLSQRQPLYRELMGRSFNLLVRVSALRDLHDTQCGFKLFRADAAQRCFAQRRIDGFAFDVEVLWLARRDGLRIAEVPVEWRHFEASRVDPVRHSLQMLRDLGRIRWLHRPRDEETRA